MDMVHPHAGHALDNGPPTLNRARWREEGGLIAKLPQHSYARDSGTTQGLNELINWS